MPGTILADRYRIVAPLGRGGMGEVYRADDLRLGQSVAIKLLPASLERDPVRLEQLHSEVRLAREVSHANVARVYDIGDAQGEPFLTMEFVDGEDLASLLRRVGRPNPEKAIEMARQICAGLAALHQQGLLHRDLKPANIMLDGQGRVRIMDFGLALRADSAEGARGGTPAYMAPEQWSGGELTRATDLYALGLVLYELFTGRGAVTASSLEEFRRWHAKAPAESLSASLTSIDPLVERVILRCLEKDPRQRPPSALAVAAMLPGGNPLEAALLAGETPSPEMVAAAGRAGRMSPARAIPLALLFLLALGTWVLLPSPYRPWEFVPLAKSPEVLKDRAEQILSKLGHTTEDRGVAWGFMIDRDAAERLQRIEGVARLERMAEGNGDPFRFYLRHSPRPLVALNAYGRVVPEDPPFERPGMTLVKLDPSGRLRAFEAVPPREVSTPAGPTASDASSRAAESAPTVRKDAGASIDPEALWPMLFAEAELDPAAFELAPSARHPRVFADRILTWNERAPADGSVPLRVEAAALDGRVVQFEVLEIAPAIDSAASAADGAGAPAVSGEERRDAVLRTLGWISISIVTLLMALMLILAIRHLRAGRGDIRGANTIALAVVCIALVRWLLLCDPSLSPGFINMVFQSGVSSALFAAALSWLLYLALEPFARRVWPSTLITWQRMLQGRLTDPLVGRDLLIGACAGVLIVLVATGALALERRLGASPTLAIGDYSWATAWLYGLAGGRRVIGLLLLAVQTGVVGPMAILLILVLSKVVLRKVWLAVLPFGVIYAAVLAVSASTPLIGVAVGAISAVLVITVMVRYGLVAMLSAQIVASLLTILPVTSDPSAWYFTAGAVGCCAVATVAGFGLWAAVAGTPSLSWERASAGHATPA